MRDLTANMVTMSLQPTLNGLIDPMQNLIGTSPHNLFRPSDSLIGVTA